MTAGSGTDLRLKSTRFDAVIALMRERYEQPAVLEIGCGEALMLRRMHADDYSRFLGIDLSEVAVQRAQAFANERAAFLKADMQAFTTEEAYDVIAFNESLYYAKDPAVVFERYLRFLKPDGCIIVTAFENKYTAPMWPALAKRWQQVNTREVRVGEQCWRIAVYDA